MARQSSARWIDGFATLHPLLAAPPAAGEAAPAEGSADAATGSKDVALATVKSRRWAGRRAEIDAASRADAAGARVVRAATSRQIERHYNNTAATWMGLVMVVGLLLVGWFLVHRLIDESRLENCLLGYRHYCGQSDHR